MRQLTMYEAKDGKIFADELQALGWEKRIDDVAIANKMLQEGSNLYDVLTKVGILDTTTLDQNKEHLIQINKDTLLKIRHWQCSDIPLYKPCNVDTEGKIFVYGGIERTYQGGYGNKVGLSDLISYKKLTDQHYAGLLNPSNLDTPMC